MLILSQSTSPNSFEFPKNFFFLKSPKNHFWIFRFFAKTELRGDLHNLLFLHSKLVEPVGSILFCFWSFASVGAYSECCRHLGPMPTKGI